MKAKKRSKMGKPFSEGHSLVFAFVIVGDYTTSKLIKLITF